ncbi:MAG: peptidase M23 [Magnetovibrio sp.]|nr:peptidase M23 [Magnetovibrio sp.]|tara:strand:- start:784 stop:1593 length:810 start_codon:yes stop_codon:yes gene_type:complete
MKQISLCLFFIMVFISDVAGELRLQGNQTQGGLVFGVTDPSNRVELNGQALALSIDGHFLIGFGRNAKKEATLKVISLDGTVNKQILNVIPRTFKTQHINGLPPRMVTPNPEDIARIREDNTEIARVRSQETQSAYFLSGFRWPVKGLISGDFGSQRILNGKPRSAHNGTDIAAPEGTVIRAPADGIVALVNKDMFFTGKTLMLDHGFGLTSVYAHMSALLVKKGDLVTQGTPIGKVGKTGRATGAHLHWGVTLNQTHLDPALIAGDMN